MICIQEPSDDSETSILEKFWEELNQSVEGFAMPELILVGDQVKCPCQVDVLWEIRDYYVKRGWNTADLYGMRTDCYEFPFQA